MNQDNISNVLWYMWIVTMGIFGALNLFSTIRNYKESTAMKNLLNSKNEELAAKDTKIIMLEARVLYLETKLHQCHDNTGTN